jgi:hypothetical protein
LPQRVVLLAVSEADFERAIASLIEAAGMAFPASAPLQMSLVVESAETATSRPRRYTAGPTPEAGGSVSSEEERAYVATIQLTGSHSGPTLAAATPYMERTRLRASTFGGTAWIYEEDGRDPLLLLRAPVAAIGR